MTKIPFCLICQRTWLLQRQWQIEELSWAWVCLQSSVFWSVSEFQIQTTSMQPLSSASSSRSLGWLLFGVTLFSVTFTFLHVCMCLQTSCLQGNPNIATVTRYIQYRRTAQPYIFSYLDPCWAPYSQEASAVAALKLKKQNPSSAWVWGITHHLSFLCKVLAWGSQIHTVT